MSREYDPEGPFITYGDGATFRRVCGKCSKFVKADEVVFVNEETGLKDQPNATCREHGRVKMDFIGFF